MNFFKAKLNFGLVALIVALALSSCKQNTAEKPTVEPASTKKEMSISEQEVLDTQQGWGEGIVKIGKAFADKGDFRTVTKEHIHQFYNYQNGTVLFKPTLASENQFRNDFRGALSYFIGEDELHPEDKGFALKPWSNVRWESNGIKIKGNMAIAMGNYYFTPAEGGDEVKVEYTFAYTKDANGKLKIIMHGSHLPYYPGE